MRQPQAGDPRQGGGASAGLSLAAVDEVAVCSLDGPAFAGVLGDSVKGQLRCGPLGARDTIVNGRVVVRDGALVHVLLDEMLAAHRRIARRFQPPA